MLKIRTEQINTMVLSNRPLLIRDISEHLQQYRPDIVSLYPRSYFNWVIDDSINIATRFNIDDVHSMRLFVRLRWDIAPGFYKQKQIADILMQTNQKAEQRFNLLTQDDFSEAWHEAQQFNSSREWRSRFWEGLND